MKIKINSFVLIKVLIFNIFEKRFLEEEVRGCRLQFG